MVFHLFQHSFININWVKICDIMSAPTDAFLFIKCHPSGKISANASEDIKQGFLRVTRDYEATVDRITLLDVRPSRHDSRLLSIQQNPSGFQWPARVWGKYTINLPLIITALGSTPHKSVKDNAADRLVNPRLTLTCSKGHRSTWTTNLAAARFSMLAPPHHHIT